MRKIILAEKYGFCMGVKRAIEIAQKLERNKSGHVFVWKDIVHNEHVSETLNQTGIRSVSDISVIPKGATVIWSAHGVAPNMWEKACQLGLKIVDVTCPLVAKVHQLAKEASKRGDTVIYLGEEGHDEQVGVKGEVKTSFITVKNLDDLKNLKVDDQAKVTVLTQTTLSKTETGKILTSLKEKFPKAVIYENVCRATTERQEAVIELAKKALIIIVVGSPKSSNTKRLKEVAESCGVKAIIVDNASELNLEELKSYDQIGVTAGASTPDWILKEVIEKIKTI